jgi:two-component system, OmpR family, sensor histidine kinase KdpD
MNIFERHKPLHYVVALVGVALITTLYKYSDAHINTTTVALSFLLVVLVTASAYGLGAGIFASIASVLCFNYFFLPPYGTLTIQEPQNWVALFAFLVTAVITSQLSSAARFRARDAERRREEVFKLYDLSRAIIATPDFETAVSSIARQVVESFQFDYCAVFLPDDGKWQRTAIGANPDFIDSFKPALTEIEMTFTDGELHIFPATRDFAQKSSTVEIQTPYMVAYVPLKVGVRSIGILVLLSTHLERGAVEAIAGMVALALERARFLQEVSHTEALRQSDELKSALLASVSHDLRTPLTSMRAAVDNLLQEEIDWDESARREFHLIISEEVNRLTRLVQNLLEMARIEANELHISKRWQAVSEIIANVLERCEKALGNHQVKIEMDETMPLVKVDSLLLAEALTNLVENAAKYSPDKSLVIIKARIESEELIISVTDEGQGIATNELNRVFDKFYRGSQRHTQRKDGTGMGLAIARGIIKAHGGKIWAENGKAKGAIFVFAIPVEQKSVTEHAKLKENDSESQI